MTRRELLMATTATLCFGTSPMLALAKHDRAIVRSLEHYRWHHRLLLVFAPKADDARLARLNTSLHDQRAEARERDIVVLRVIGSNVALGDHHKPSPGLGATLRRDHKVRDQDVALILVGKDGGEKARQTPGTLDLGALWAQIDAMPMRRREMRERRR